jgi:prophage regulatory protein
MVRRTGVFSADPSAIIFLRRRDVERLTGLPRFTLFDMMYAGRFPRPVRLGEKAVGWIEAEVVEWQRSRIADRDDAEAA